jgi:hypothetical protein
MGNKTKQFAPYELTVASEVASSLVLSLSKGFCNA